MSRSQYYKGLINLKDYLKYSYLGDRRMGNPAYHNNFLRKALNIYGKKGIIRPFYTLNEDKFKKYFHKSNMN